MPRVLPRFLVIALLATSLSWGRPVHASHTGPIGSDFDLTYKEVMKTNGIASGDWLGTWLRDHPGPPLKKTLRRWRRGPVVASMLVDCPAFHAAERSAYYFVRAEDAAYYWAFVDGKVEEEGPVPLVTFDSLLATLSALDQAPPLPAERAAPDVPPGYFGFLSTFDRGVTRQILLTLEDFYVAKGGDWNHPTDGRLQLIMGPVVDALEREE